MATEQKNPCGFAATEHFDCCKDYPHEARCARPTCGHPQSWHRHDDADTHDPSDPACPFRCIGYDCEALGAPPVNPCACPNFVDAPTETTDGH
jgi:hypothetical protein